MGRSGCWQRRLAGDPDLGVAPGCLDDALDLLMGASPPGQHRLVNLLRYLPDAVLEGPHEA
jgi:hypothetical protein